MGRLVAAAFLQQVAQRRQRQLPAWPRPLQTLAGRLLAQQGVDAFHLRRVVTIHEGLHRLDGRIHRTRSAQRGQRSRQPPGQAPQRQQATAPARRHRLLHQLEVPKLGLQMVGGENAHRRVPRHREHAAVDHDGTRLAGVVGAQFPQQVEGQRSRLVLHGPHLIGRSRKRRQRTGITPSPEDTTAANWAPVPGVATNG